MKFTDQHRALVKAQDHQFRFRDIQYLVNETEEVVSTFQDVIDRISLIDREIVPFK